MSTHYSFVSFCLYLPLLPLFVFTFALRKIMFNIDFKISMFSPITTFVRSCLLAFLYWIGFWYTLTKSKREVNSAALKLFILLIRMVIFLKKIQFGFKFFFTNKLFWAQINIQFFYIHIFFKKIRLKDKIKMKRIGDNFDFYLKNLF
jgi:hypothetical protein